MLTNQHNGHRVPWHFDSPRFDYHGEAWEIVWNEDGAARGLDNVIYTIRRKSDRHEERYSHKELVRILTEEKKYQDNHIERKRQTEPA